MQTGALSDTSESLSLDALQRLWAELNRTYFEGRLPPIRIQWSTRLTSTAGLFVSQHGPRSRWISSEERHGVGRVIRLSFPLHQGQAISEIRSTLAHEMIHQWQFDVKKCRPTHGREFRRVMKAMNRDGLGITIYHTLITDVPALATYAWQCVQCGRSYTRQRRTLSVKRHRCGECYGALREVHAGEQSRLVDGQHIRASDSVYDSAVSQVLPIQLSFPFSG